MLVDARAHRPVKCEDRIPADNLRSLSMKLDAVVIERSEAVEIGGIESGKVAREPIGSAWLAHYARAGTGSASSERDIAVKPSRATSIATISGPRAAIPSVVASEKFCSMA